MSSNFNGLRKFYLKYITALEKTLNSSDFDRYTIFYICQEKTYQNIFCPLHLHNRNKISIPFFSIAFTGFNINIYKCFYCIDRL